MQNKKFGLTAAHLKWIAIILMFVNHLCYCLYKNVGINNYFLSDAHWYLTRVSFVIFAFQIAEGMYYTRNRKKYIASLFIFAFASEFIYDLCFYNTFLEFSDQNVFFNLAFGALAIAIIDALGRKPLYAIAVTLFFMVICVWINANYSFLAEALIVSFYYFREDKKKQLIISFITFAVFTICLYMHSYASRMSISEMLVNANFWYLTTVELHGLLAWPIFMLYNGQKGKNVNKWFFYLFYPAHLLFLYFLCLILK